MAESAYIILTRPVSIGRQDLLSIFQFIKSPILFCSLLKLIDLSCVGVASGLWSSTSYLFGFVASLGYNIVILTNYILGMSKNNNTDV